MHIRMISKPVSAATGFDPAALITAKATMLNAITTFVQIPRFFGINLTSK